MNRIIYVLFLCFSLIFISILSGCGDKSQEISRESERGTLPPVEIIAENKIVPSGGTSRDIVKDLVVKYLMDSGIKGDIKSKLSIDEITIKEAWENLEVQLYNIKLEYAWVYGVIVVKDGKVLSLLSGMPVFESFLADIDNDGKYEIYSNVSFGSGIVSDDISGYNIAADTKYYMSKRTEKDFKLFIQDNELLVKEQPYGLLSKGSGDKSPEIKALKIKNSKLILE